VLNSERQELAKNYMAFTKKFALKWTERHYCLHLLNELMGEALFVLVRCADRYDSSSKFTSYLIKSLHRALSKCLLELNWGKRVHITGEYITLFTLQEDSELGEEAIELPTEIDDFDGILKSVHLNKQEKEVLTMVYKNDMNLTEVGKEKCLTRERIRQVHKSAIDKFRRKYGSVQKMH